MPTETDILRRTLKRINVLERQVSGYQRRIQDLERKPAGGFVPELVGSGNLDVTSTNRFVTESNDDANITIPEDKTWLMVNFGYPSSSSADYEAGDWIFINVQQLLGKDASTYGALRNRDNAIRLEDAIQNSHAFFGYETQSDETKVLLFGSGNNNDQAMPLTVYGI